MNNSPVKMRVFKTIPEIQSALMNLKQSGKTIGIVPTMGALHIGHESLIERARQECDVVVVSIFVNPIQFGPNEDYNRYPRQLEHDCEICEKIGVDFIFEPTEKEIYPGKYNTIVVPPEYYQDRLCGKSRAGHFNGVATIVLKLFNITVPDRAYFGEKDAQQLAIINKMVQDLNLSIKIVSCPIIRDADGLACSSRNRYLSPQSREKALTLYKTLKARNIGLLHPDIELEYFEEAELGCEKFIAIAAKVDGVRLIDNIRMEGE